MRIRLLGETPLLLEGPQDLRQIGPTAAMKPMLCLPIDSTQAAWVVIRCPSAPGRVVTVLTEATTSAPLYGFVPLPWKTDA